MIIGDFLDIFCPPLSDRITKTASFSIAGDGHTIRDKERDHTKTWRSAGGIFGVSFLPVLKYSLAGTMMIDTCDLGNIKQYPLDAACEE